MKSKLIKLLLVVIPILIISFRTINDNEFIYKLTIESIFKPEEAAKIESDLIRNNVPFSIVKIDYNAKVIVIKCSYTVEFDAIKQGFEKVGVKVIEDEIYKTLEDYNRKNK